MFAAVGLQPHRAAGGDHLGGQQPRPAELTDYLPEGIVGVARHRRLEHRRIDYDPSDRQGCDGRYGWLACGGWGHGVGTIWGAMG